MRHHRLLIAWLLLLVPTLLLGVGALRLLDSEEARRSADLRQAAQARVESLADQLDLGIAEVQEGLMTTLQQLAGGDAVAALDDWNRSNPLVRNVFVWEKGRGLLFPDPERPASDEEAQFVRRYLTLFARQGSWQTPAADVVAAAPSPADSLLAERKALRSLASQSPAPAAASAEAGIADGEQGWLTWFADNRLHLLGWYQPAGSPRRIGVEIEMMALLGRLLAAFPTPNGDGETLALLDGEGAVFHQSGPLVIAAKSRPLASATLPRLPHWQVVVYPAVVGGGASSFLLIATLLVGTFVLAILLGGTVLLRQAYRERRDALQKTSFVSNVSHELKTPLTTIRMYAELLDEGKVAGEEKRRRYLQTIVRESQRLTRLVNNILDFSRLEQGRKDYHFESLDLGQLLSELLDRQSMRLDEAGLSLERILPPALIVSADRDAIEQIVLNLLDNAIKYAAAGKTLTIELQSRGTQAVLQVRDRGPGIPAEQQRRVFDKFHRLDASLTARQQGTGLGLSIARQLALGIGGDLLCCDHPGGGACFELTLPVEEGR